MENREYSTWPILMSVCRNSWRRILLFAVLLGLLGGGYKAWSLLSADRAQSVPAELSAGEDVENEVHADYKANLEEIERQIENRSEYVNQSLLAQLNPYREGRAVVSMTVNTRGLEEAAAAAVPAADRSEEGDETSYAAEGAQAGNVLNSVEQEAYDLLYAYFRFLNFGVDWSALEEEYETEGRYLSELVSLKLSDQVLNRMEITVCFATTEGAEEILDELIRQAEEKRADFVSEYGAHELVFTCREAAYVADSSRYSYFTQRIQDLNSLITQRTNLKTNSAALSTPAVSAVSTKLSRKALLKGAAVYAVLGAVGGVVLCFLICVLRLLLSGRTVSAEELNRIYGLRKLAAVPTKKTAELKGLARVFAGSELRYLSSGETEVACRIAAENIEELAGGARKLALIGDVDPSELMKTAESLQALHAETGAAFIYLPLGELQSSPSSLRRLREADGAILVSVIGSSAYGRIDQILETAAAYKKDVIGSITFA